VADIVLIEATIDDIRKHGVCGYKDPRTPGFNEKVAWLEDRFAEGLKIILLLSNEDGVQGMIEYIPGEYCWRPVNAGGYAFIHCIFVGFKKKYKNQGYASQLIESCEQDARRTSDGVAIVTRKSSFMVGSKLFKKNGYEVVGNAQPDFELLVKKFNRSAPDPSFRTTGQRRVDDYGQGITILRTDQCPYTVKNVNEIVEHARSEYRTDVRVVDLTSCRESQNSPCAFGSFCLIIDGEIVADHPISKGRFANIMKKRANP